MILDQQLEDEFSYYCLTANHSPLAWVSRKEKQVVPEYLG